MPGSPLARTTPVPTTLVVHSALAALVVLATLVAPPAAAQNAPTATVSRTVFAGGEVTACRMVDVDPVSAAVSGNCAAALPGGTPTVNFGAASATTAGVLRSMVEIGRDGPAPGSYLLAPGALVQSFASAQFQDRLLVSPLSGEPLPERVRLWLSIDGVLEETFGLPTNSLARATTFTAISFAPTLSSPATSRLIVGADGSTFYDRPGATFAGTIDAELSDGGRRALVDGVVGSHDFLLTAGGFDFAVFVGVGAAITNPTALAVNLVGGSQRADFLNTGRLVAAQAFDAAGRDVSASFTFTTGAGLTLVAGAPAVAVVPEPRTAALLAGGLLALAVGARRARAARV